MIERSAARIAWALWAVSMALTMLALVFLTLSWSTPLPGEAFGFRGFAGLFAVVFSTVGVLVASRVPANPIGWLLLATGVASGVQELAQDYAVYAVLTEPGRLPGGEYAAWIPAWIWVPVTATITVFLFPIFPSGQLLSPRWRVVPVVGAVGVLVAAVGLALAEGPVQNFRPVDNPFGIIASGQPGGPPYVAGLSLYLLAMLGGLASLVVRFRRSRGDERQQMKWLAVAAALVAVALATSFVTPGIQGVAPRTAVTDALETIVILSFATIPVAVGVAVLRYRLYAVDLVINKAVVYGALAVFITLVYVAIVVGAGAAIGARSNTALSAAAAAVIALAFQPARRRAQHLANRLVYGRRATPYEVLSELSSRFASTYSLEDALPRLARVTAEAVGADHTTVWLRAEDQLVPVAAWPSSEGVRQAVLISGEEVAAAFGEAETGFPVRHQGELLGAISVTMPSNEPLSPAQAKLLADVAAQAGLVLRNVALVADLRASRQRIVTAQDERARKLERDIHDGAQQQLVALSVKLRLAEQVTRRDAEKAAEMLSSLQHDITDALENLRDLARGIYPPLLADKGLTAAIEAQARKSQVSIVLDPNGIGRYQQEAESAVYFCVLEALQNVSKYAEAKEVRIRMGETNGDLTFVVQDDGVGFDPQTPHGAGLANMRDRLEALGGMLQIRSAPGAGTTVTGRISVTPREVAG